MCENFICSKLMPPDHGRRLADQGMPEPCFESANCQICELMYDCSYCVAANNCPQGKTRTSETRRIAKDSGRKGH